MSLNDVSGKLLEGDEVLIGDGAGSYEIGFPFMYPSVDRHHGLVEGGHDDCQTHERRNTQDSTVMGAKGCGHLRGMAYFLEFLPSSGLQHGNLPHTQRH